MCNSLGIRRAQLGDVEQLVALRIKFLSEISVPPLDMKHFYDSAREYFQEKILSNDYIGWFAEIDGKVVGTGGLVFFERPPQFNNFSGIEAYIMNIYTLKEWRNHGVASNLLQRAISFARERKANRIWLHTTQKASKIYEEFGFQFGTSEMEIIYDDFAAQNSIEREVVSKS